MLRIDGHLRIKKLDCHCTGYNEISFGSLPQITIAAMFAKIFKEQKNKVQLYKYLYINSFISNQCK